MKPNVISSGMKFVLAILCGLPAAAMAAGADAAAGSPPPLVYTAHEDHDLMMKMLGMTNFHRVTTDNYDESIANRYPNLPDPLTLKNGKKVTTPEMWWKQRRPEIVEDYEREFYGRIPANVPGVTWTVTSVTNRVVSYQGTNFAVIEKRLMGHVDNSSYTNVSVDMQFTFTVPANVAGPVPLIIQLTAGGFGGGGGLGFGGGGFGGGGFGGPLTADQTTKLNASITAAQADFTALQDKLTAAQQDVVTAVLAKADDAAVQAKLEAVAKIQTDIAMLRYDKGVSVIAPSITDAQKTNINANVYTTFFAAPPPGPAIGGGRGAVGFGGFGGLQDWQAMALGNGWGYGTFSTYTVQADGAAGFSQGIIGLVNKGQHRKLDDWGVLRAWAWGASRALDYLETDPLVDAKQVGLEGHSRWGKATIVAMAFDQRFAIAYPSSSGFGGAEIERRNYGEVLENGTWEDAYHWYAANLIKYAGLLTPGDLPVDGNELVAMCAPRPVFIGGGNPTDPGGDGHADPKGMFMATAGASPVYELLGKRGLGTTELPPIGTALIDGDVAYREHTGGHTDGPNWPTFMQFAAHYLKGPGLKPAPAAGGGAN